MHVEKRNFGQKWEHGMIIFSHFCEVTQIHVSTYFPSRFAGFLAFFHFIFCGMGKGKRRGEQIVYLFLFRPRKENLTVCTSIELWGLMCGLRENLKHQPNIFFLASFAHFSLCVALPVITSSAVTILSKVAISRLCSSFLLKQISLVLSTFPLSKQWGFKTVVLCPLLMLSIFFFFLKRGIAQQWPRIDGESERACDRILSHKKRPAVWLYWRIGPLLFSMQQVVVWWKCLAGNATGQNHVVLWYMFIYFVYM